MPISIKLFVSTIIIILISCDKVTKDKNMVVIETYKSYKTTEVMVMDGRLNEDIWKKAEEGKLDNFYQIEKITDKQAGTFKMVWDEENLYLAFQMEDKYINAKETKRDGEPYLDDCAELFVTPLPEANKIHCAIEVNVKKTSNDIIYIEDYYKGEKGVVKAFTPSLECGVVIDGSLNNNSDIDKGWVMELKIPLINFWGMDGFQKAEVGNKWSFLTIRQERNEAAIGRRICSTNYPIKDLSGIHDSKSFGLMEFVE